MLLAPRDDGTFDLRIGAVERRLLTDVCAELRELLDDRSDHPVARRLFPTAYPDDAEHEAFFQQMVHDDLVQSRIEALRTVERTADASTLTLDELETWMVAVNAVRLTLGTRLDVSEDRDLDDVNEGDPDFPSYVVYDFLGLVLDSIVRVLSPR